MRRASGDGPHGCVVEHIELCDALLREQFTVEAALILHEAGV
jgi:hypothetical protein